MKLYIVRKILDKETGEKMSESRLYGQASIVHAPTAEYAKRWRDRKSDPQTFSQWVYDNYQDLYQKQDKIDPIIGMPVFFVSTKPDAGTWRTSAIESIEHRANGDIILETLKSVYLLREDD